MWLSCGLKLPSPAVFNDTFSVLSLYDIYLYIYIYVCIYVYIYICVYIYMYVCVCVWVCVYSGTGSIFCNKQFRPKVTFCCTEKKKTPLEWTADQKGVDCSKRWRDWTPGKTAVARQSGTTGGGDVATDSVCSASRNWSAAAGKSAIVVTNCSLSHAAICSATNMLVRRRGGGWGRKRRGKGPWRVVLLGYQVRSLAL